MSVTVSDLRYERSRLRARVRALRWALFLSKLEGVGLRIERAAWRLFNLPGYLLNLPDGHPHRWYAGQVVLYLGAFAIVAALTLRRIHGGMP